MIGDSLDGQILLVFQVFPKHLQPRLIAQIKAYNDVKNYIPQEDESPLLLTPTPYHQTDFSRLNWRRPAGEQDFLKNRKDRTDHSDDFDRYYIRSNVASLSVTWLILGCTTVMLLFCVAAHFFYESRDWARRERARQRLRKLQREQENIQRVGADDGTSSPRSLLDHHDPDLLHVQKWLHTLRQAATAELQTYRPNWDAGKLSLSAQASLTPSIQPPPSLLQPPRVHLTPPQIGRHCSQTGQRKSKVEEWIEMEAEETWVSDGTGRGEGRKAEGSVMSAERWSTSGRMASRWRTISARLLRSPRHSSPRHSSSQHSSSPLHLPQRRRSHHLRPLSETTTALELEIASLAAAASHTPNSNRRFSLINTLQQFRM